MRKTVGHGCLPCLCCLSVCIQMPRTSSSTSKTGQPEPDRFRLTAAQTEASRPAVLSTRPRSQHALHDMKTSQYKRKGRGPQRHGTHQPDPKTINRCIKLSTNTTSRQTPRTTEHDFGCQPSSSQPGLQLPHQCLCFWHPSRQGGGLQSVGHFVGPLLRGPL